MLDREYWVDYFSQFDRSAIEKLTENILEKRAGNAHRMAAEKPRMKPAEYSLQNEKKEANYEKILFPAGVASGV